MQYQADPYRSKLIIDSLVKDDQSIAVNVKEKGLIIISACSHSGIINAINYGKFLTGFDKMFAVLVGFHLTGGKMYDEEIEPTIKELKKVNPKYIVPCHCTG